MYWSPTLLLSSTSFKIANISNIGLIIKLYLITADFWAWVRHTFNLAWTVGVVVTSCGRFAWLSAMTNAAKTSLCLLFRWLRRFVVFFPRRNWPQGFSAIVIRQRLLSRLPSYSKCDQTGLSFFLPLLGLNIITVQQIWKSNPILKLLTKTLARPFEHRISNTINKHHRTLINIGWSA